MPGGPGALVAGQPADRVGAVGGKNRTPRDGPLRVEQGQFRPQFVGGLVVAVVDLVLLERHDHPVAREHRRAGHDGCGGDAVDAHVRTQPDRQLANQVVDGGLADVVGLAAVLRHDGVRRAGQHDAGGQPLRPEDLVRLLRQHVVAADVDRQRLAPHVFGWRAGSRRGVDGGGVDHDIQAAESEDAGLQRVADAAAAAQIHGDCQRHLDGAGLGGLARRVLSGGQIQIGYHHVGAAPGQLHHHVAADAARAAHHQGHLAAELALRRHPLQLGLLERPILDAKRLQPRQRHVIAVAGEVLGLLRHLGLGHRPDVGRGALERVGAGHHVDGVDEELGGDSRLALVLGEAEQAEPRHHHDRRVGVAQLRRLRVGVRVVVGLVIRAIPDRPLGDQRLQLVQVLRGRIPRHEHRADARAQEVIGAAGPEAAQLLRPGRVGERHRVVGAIPVRHGTPVGRSHAAQVRQDGHRRRLGIARSGHSRSTEHGPAAASRMVSDELPHLIDGADAAQVAGLLCVAPGEQAVPAEHDAVAAGMLLHHPPQHQRQLEPGPLPRQPRQLAAVGLVELGQLVLAVGAGRERDRPVRVQVIDVIERQERVQRRVDRSGDAALAEGRERVERHHLVFVGLAAVATDQGFELVGVEDREPRGGDRPQVAAAALHRQHPGGLPGERIGQVELGAGVAAAEVGDPQVVAEAVGAVAQLLERG